MDFSPRPSANAGARHALLIDLAQAEARRLRQQAVRDFGSDAACIVGEVWREANAVWACSVARTVAGSRAALERSSHRLMSRLQRHAALRQQPPGAGA